MNKKSTDLVKLQVTKTEFDNLVRELNSAAENMKNENDRILINSKLYDDNNVEKTLEFVIVNYPKAKDRLKDRIVATVIFIVCILLIAFAFKGQGKNKVQNSGGGNNTPVEK